MADPIDGGPDCPVARAFRTGVQLGDGTRCQPARLEVMPSPPEDDVHNHDDTHNPTSSSTGAGDEGSEPTGSQLDAMGGTEASHRGTRVRVFLREGKYHQIRRMMGALGHHVSADVVLLRHVCWEWVLENVMTRDKLLLWCQVESIHRVSVGPVQLGDLQVGEWRPLTMEEQRQLVYDSKTGIGRSVVEPDQGMSS